CQYSLSNVTKKIIKYGLNMPVDTYIKAKIYQVYIKKSWKKIAGDCQFILTPSAAGQAPSGLNYTGSAAFNRMWSVLGWPCLSVPVQVERTCLPLGVQLIGDYMKDMEVLSFAKYINQ